MSGQLFPKIPANQVALSRLSFAPWQSRLHRITSPLSESPADSAARQAASGQISVTIPPVGVKIPPMGQSGRRLWSWVRPAPSGGGGAGRLLLRPAGGGRCPSTAAGWRRSAPCTPTPTVVVRAATIANDADAERLAAMLRRDDRPIEGVIDAMPVEPRSRQADRPADRRTARDPRQAICSRTSAAARHLIPLLAETKRGGSYVLIGGPGSEASWPNYGCRSVAAAGSAHARERAARRSAVARRARADAARRAPVRGETCVAISVPNGRAATPSASARCRLIDREAAANPARPVVRFARPRRARRRWRRIRSRRDDYQTVSVSGRAYVPEGPDLR